MLDSYPLPSKNEEEEMEEGNDWSKSLVAKKVTAMRARAPIWCERVQGVEEGGPNTLLLMLTVLPIALFDYQ